MCYDPEACFACLWTLTQLLVMNRKRQKKLIKAAKANKALPVKGGGVPVGGDYPLTCLGVTSEAFGDALGQYVRSNPDSSLKSEPLLLPSEAFSISRRPSCKSASVHAHCLVPGLVNNVVLCCCPFKKTALFPRVGMLGGKGVMLRGRLGGGGGQERVKGAADMGIRNSAITAIIPYQQDLCVHLTFLGYTLITTLH